ncbi:uncharacterized protein N7477_005310 [Penicillium maclennaniae]|uniref:uncharacterized protein n=1 Tax=Penicillium maclennaniae TaxID=1343394 RepID=UPI0025405410|nr:uncharacterized protein N7477_005310 [Penicillium maclennaniae]KAJ5669947.1 hypothetical protein N7477_005310 [Penicillium maclennaniae]
MAPVAGQIRRSRHPVPLREPSRPQKKSHLEIAGLKTVSDAAASDFQEFATTQDASHTPDTASHCVGNDDSADARRRT